MVKILESKTYSTKGIAQISREEKPALIHGVTVRVEPDHQSCGHYGGDNAYEHDETPVIPFVAEPAHGQDDDSANNTTRYVEDELLTISANNFHTERLITYRLLRSIAKCRQ
jgi:hypothetical protein